MEVSQEHWRGTRPAWGPASQGPASTWKASSGMRPRKVSKTLKEFCLAFVLFFHLTEYIYYLSLYSRGVKWNWARSRGCTTSLFYPNVNASMFAAQLFSDVGMWKAFRWWTCVNKTLSTPLEKPKWRKCISSFFDLPALVGRTFIFCWHVKEPRLTLQWHRPGVFLFKLPPDFKVSGRLANLICDSPTFKRSATITAAVLSRCGCLISVHSRKTAITALKCLLSSCADGTMMFAKKEIMIPVCCFLRMLSW